MPLVEQQPAGRKPPRVLVTRAPHQASALGDALVAYGLRVVSIATIALAPPSDEYATLDREITRLDEYDWLLFTSANAVAVFAERLEDERVPLSCGIASMARQQAKHYAMRAFPSSCRHRPPSRSRSQRRCCHTRRVRQCCWSAPRPDGTCCRTS